MTPATLGDELDVLRRSDNNTSESLSVYLSRLREQPAEYFPFLTWAVVSRQLNICFRVWHFDTANGSTCKTDHQIRPTLINIPHTPEAEERPYARTDSLGDFHVAFMNEHFSPIMNEDELRLANLRAINPLTTAPTHL